MYEANLRELSHTFNPFVSLCPRVRGQLELLGQIEALPVCWEDFSSLSLAHGLFQDNFVGLEELGRKISRMASIHICLLTFLISL